MSFFQELKRRNVVRVGVAYILMGWLLLQGADFVLDLIDAPNWVIQAFALLVVCGLPIALFLAWAFELTPEGVKREAEVDRTQSITSKTGRKLDFAIIGFLALVIILMAVERLNFAGKGETAAVVQPDELSVQTNGADSPSESTPQADPKSIAVLPFADLSQAQDQKWFADGLAEEILNALVKVPDLSVASRTSSFQYRDSSQSMAEIASELGVAHVLEGSIRSSGDRIRVTAQLIRASDGFHLWSESYDRENADMISIQEDLAQNIASVLETSMDPEALEQMAQVGTRSVEAYQAYLRGVQIWAAAFSYSAGSAENRKAFEQFETALEYDPNFSEAHVRVAEYWKLEFTPTGTAAGSSGATPQEALSKFYTHIQLAIDNAQSPGDRLRSLGHRAMVDLRLKDARDLYEQYLEISPNDESIRSELGNVLQMMSEHTAASEVLEHWRIKGESDLFSAGLFINSAYRSIDPSVAADFGLEAMKRWPASSTLAYQTHRTLLWAERYAEASSVAARYKTLEPGDTLLVEAREACASGNRNRAEEILARIELEQPENFSQLWLINNMLGNSEQETEVLRPLEDFGIPYSLADFLSYPKFDPRPFPSLMAVLEREGIQRPEPPVQPFRCPPR